MAAATPLKIYQGQVLQFQTGDSLPVALGGTGANDAATALANLGGVSASPTTAQTITAMADVSPVSVIGYNSSSTKPLTRWFQGGVSPTLVAWMGPDGVLYSTGFSGVGGAFTCTNTVNVTVAPNANLTWNGTNWGTVACGSLGLTTFPAAGSISFWLKTPASLTGIRTVFSTKPGSTDSVRMTINNLGIVTVYSGGSSINGGAVSANTAYHYLITWRANNTFTVYKNGAQAGTGTVSKPATMGSLTIGGYGDNSNTTCWNGQIDDFRFYDAELTAGNAVTLYNAGAGGESILMTGLLGAWQFNEGTGTQAADASGNGNTGTISGSGVSWQSGGIPATTPATSPDTMTFLSVGDGAAANEVGILTLGDPDGGTRIQGQSVKIYTAGVLRITVTQAGLWGVNDLSPGAWLSVKGDGTVPTFQVRHTGGEDAVQVYLDGTIIAKVSAAGVIYQGTLPVRPVGNALAGGRLTLSSNLPVPNADTMASAGGTLYYLPYKHNSLSVHDGTAWDTLTFSSLTVSVPAGTGVHDVFAYNNGGVLALTTLAWTNTTTRATALAYQDGVLVLSSNTTRRYLGTIYCVSGLADTEAKRHVWNFYNRVPKKLRATNATTSWTYASTTWRPCNNDSTVNLSTVTGVQENWTTIEVTAFAQANANSDYPQVAVGVNSTTTPTADWNTRWGQAVGQTSVQARLRTQPAVGVNVYYWLESADTGTVSLTFFSSLTNTRATSCITGEHWC